MNIPKISIIIANYNNGHFFHDCYRSLCEQTEINWEAIIIDDCSTDNSMQVIQNLIKDDKRCKFYFNKENIGYQKTIIKAIELSTTPLFGRLDPDDALLSFALEKSLKIHSAFPEVGLVYSNFIFSDSNLNELSVHYGKQITKLNEEYFNFNGEVSHFATFKKNIYNLTSGIDPHNKRAEDKDIYMKMCEIAPVKHIDETLYRYRIHDKSASTKLNSEKAFFWHFVALIKMAERRGYNIEDLFFEKFVIKSKYKSILDAINNSRWIKLGKKLGFGPINHE